VLAALGRRAALVNLDPANGAPAEETADGRRTRGTLPYEPFANVVDVAAPEHVAPTLGPNGALLACAEAIAADTAWLDATVARARATLGTPSPYFVFDCAGQVELYTQHTGLARVATHLMRAHDMRLCAVHLVDSVCLADPAAYTSALVLSLTGMLLLGLPHVNVLSKADLIPRYASDTATMPFPLEYYTEAQGLHHIAEALLPTTPSSQFGLRWQRLTEAVCGVVEDFGLVGFSLVTATDAQSVLDLLHTVDKANGFAFDGMTADGTGDDADGLSQSLFGVAACAAAESELQRMADIRERLDPDGDE
jgi:hypothetical protein